MECEKELCPLCNKPKVIGKEFVIKVCLHTICEECYIKKPELCPICIQPITNKRKFLRDCDMNERRPKYSE